MLAAAWLGSWIATHHLTDAGVAAARARFGASDARAVVLDDFLVDPVARQLGRFLGDDAEYTTGLGLKGRYGYVDEADFLAAPESDRFFRYGRLARVTGPATRGPDFAAFERINRALGDPRARALFEALTGTRLGAVTLSARSMRRGEFLAPHTDDIGERLISFVLYLTPGWRPEHGGALMLEHWPAATGASPARAPVASGETRRHTRVVPLFNRLVLFDARTWHHIEPILPPDLARVTLGGWFLVPPT